MAPRKARRPEPCGQENCGSRRFHVGDDGYTYCDQGHQQSERGTVVAEDTGELVTLGRKQKRRDSDAESTATSRSHGFSGIKAYEHYLLCLQLVLRKQLRWLIDIQKLPEELETIVRDMWALRLQKVQIKVSHDSGTDTEGNSQMFSSQSEGETGTDTDGSRASRRRQRKQSEVSVNLVDTLSLCYIGILLLRIPLTVADLHRWCNDGKLLYYKSSKEVPAGMVERLPGEYQQLLEAQDLLPPQRLHASVLKTVSSFSEELGMLPPSPNHPLLMYRWVRELSLPLEVFSGTQRLARILGIDFNFKVRAKAGSSVVLRYPEAQLMALIVVATKLLFPMHCTEQIAQSSSDLSALTMNWDAWVGARPRKTVEHGDGEGLNFEQAFNFSETECLENADQQLDQYLDWYENNVASETVRTRGRAGKDADFRHNLFSMFPLEASKMDADQIQTPQATSQDTNMLRYVQRSLTTRPSVSASNSAKPSLRPGSLYRRYRKAQELNGVVRMFYQAAAELAGLSLEGIVQAVFLLERKLQKYEEKLRDKA